MKLSLRHMILTAMFAALGLVLPFLTGQIPQIGRMLLPMHIPVLLCGIVCGWGYGAGLGLVLPILRSLLFGMPVLYPTATAMAFELLTYGLVVGLVYRSFSRRNIGTLYASLLIAMVSGRVVWGIVQYIQFGIGGTAFTWQAFFAGAFLDAIPGIALQLVLIPAIITAVETLSVRPAER